LTYKIKERAVQYCVFLEQAFVNEVQAKPEDRSQSEGDIDDIQRGDGYHKVAAAPAWGQAA
jgi:hypothetical protein